MPSPTAFDRILVAWRFAWPNQLVDFLFIKIVICQKHCQCYGNCCCWSLVITHYCSYKTTQFWPVCSQVYVCNNWYTCSAVKSLLFIFSSLSSSLNSAAAVTWQDIFSNFTRNLSERKKALFTKLIGKQRLRSWWTCPIVHPDLVMSRWLNV